MSTLEDIGKQIAQNVAMGNTRGSPKDARYSARQLAEYWRDESEPLTFGQRARGAVYSVVEDATINRMGALGSAIQRWRSGESTSFLGALLTTSGQILKNETFGKMGVLGELILVQSSSKQLQEMLRNPPVKANKKLDTNDKLDAGIRSLQKYTIDIGKQIANSQTQTSKALGDVADQLDRLAKRDKKLETAIDTVRKEARQALSKLQTLLSKPSPQQNSFIGGTRQAATQMSHGASRMTAAAQAATVRAAGASSKALSGVATGAMGMAGRGLAAGGAALLSNPYVLAALGVAAVGGAGYWAYNKWGRGDKSSPEQTPAEPKSKTEATRVETWNMYAAQNINIEARRTLTLKASTIVLDSSRIQLPNDFWRQARARISGATPENEPQSPPPNQGTQQRGQAQQGGQITTTDPSPTPENYRGPSITGQGGAQSPEMPPQSSGGSNRIPQSSGGGGARWGQVGIPRTGELGRYQQQQAEPTIDASKIGPLYA